MFASPPLPAPDEAIRAEWCNRVAAEYHSAAITQHLTLWLIQVGASPDLIRAGLRIAEDELVHAEVSFAVLAAAGGAMAAPLDRATLQLHRNLEAPLEHDIVRTVVEVFCLGETVAVPLFAALRAGCTVPVAREALDRILVDEVRHRDFGWTALAWLLETPLGAELRAVVQVGLPDMLARQRISYAPQPGAVTPAQQAWGLMAPGRYAALLAETVGRQYRPRFHELGIDLSAES